MRNYDGGIWRFTWQRTPEGRFRAWVVSHPHISVEADSFDAAEEAMRDRVDHELQAGEWTADWDPAPPVPAGAPYQVHPDYVILIPEGRYILFADPDRVFDGGICTRCGTAKGPRSSLPLTIYVEIIGGIMSAFNGESDYPDLVRMSLVEALGPQRLGSAEVRTVNRLGRALVAELIATPIAKAIAVRGIPLFGWRCPLCKHARFSNHIGQAEYVNVFPASAIPRDLESFWVAHREPRLCVRREWWSTVREKPAFRGVIAWPLYTTSPEQIDPDPVLREHEDVGSTRDRARANQNRLLKACRLTAIPTW